VGEATDEEIERLLRRVYVEGGYTPAEVATAAFAAPAVRARGRLIVVRDAGLVGMLIVVAPGSPAARLAGPDEAEMHLLAVLPEARGRGVGAALVDAAVAAARETGARRMVLWTQPSMAAAQRLYAAAGFARAPERDARIAAVTGREFRVYERGL
jgi:ribosomal protein S18 acetylase RimI-like enzyme